ncbi:hypothetical protein LZ30DRAFT_331033 [Colletotrichum cereale]|nr:hypothetical protein LZ30DRAFT_331033 [Colletotrichum cereale]
MITWRGGDGGEGSGSLSPKKQHNTNGSIQLSGSMGSIHVPAAKRDMDQRDEEEMGKPTGWRRGGGDLASTTRRHSTLMIRPVPAWRGVCVWEDPPVNAVWDTGAESKCRRLGKRAMTLGRTEWSSKAARGKKTRLKVPKAWRGPKNGLYRDRFRLWRKSFYFIVLIDFLFRFESPSPSYALKAPFKRSFRIHIPGSTASMPDT